MHSAKIHPKNPESRHFPQTKPGCSVRQASGIRPRMPQRCMASHAIPHAAIRQQTDAARTDIIVFLGKMSELFPDSATKEYQKMSEICPKKVKFYRYKRGISLLALFF